MARRKRGNSWGGLANVPKPRPTFTSPQNSFMQPGQSGYRPAQPASPSVPSAGPGGAPVGGRPLDWQEQAYGLSASRNLALSNAGAAYQRGSLEQEFGYGPSGLADPYSRAARLEENYKRSKLGTTNSMASAGQLYSGAYGRAQNENQRQYSIAADQNRRQYDQQIYGLNQAQAQAAAQYETGVDDEAFAALLRALGGK